MTKFGRLTWALISNRENVYNLLMEYYKLTDKELKFHVHRIRNILELRRSLEGNVPSSIGDVKYSALGEEYFLILKYVNKYKEIR